MLLRKKHIIAIVGVMSAAVGLVTILAWNALKETNVKNGFSRKFASFELNLLNAEKKNKDIIEICGTTPYHFYFQTSQPNRFWITDHNLKNGHLEKANVPVHPGIASAFIAIVDSPEINIMAVNIPAVITAKPNAKTELYRFPNALYTRVVKIGQNSYVFRGFDSTIRAMDQIFYKGNPKTATIQREIFRVVERKQDGGISTDGCLSYDPLTGYLTYVLFYSNQFICLDTNLTVVYKTHTIDTIASYRATAGMVKTREESLVTNTSASRTINGMSYVDEGQLYNISKLKADNETDQNFRKNTVIDIYNISNGAYQGSFYIPAYKNEKASKFSVVKNKVLAVYTNHYVVYDLNSKAR
jgi:hypothetical protein